MQADRSRLVQPDAIRPAKPAAPGELNDVKVRCIRAGDARPTSLVENSSDAHSLNRDALNQIDVQFQKPNYSIGRNVSVPPSMSGTSSCLFLAS